MRHEYFFGVIKLSDQIVGVEFVIYVEFLIGHSEPGEVHLSPRRTVLNNV
jgi:hypothetical protein